MKSPVQYRAQNLKPLNQRYKNFHQRNMAQGMSGLQTLRVGEMRKYAKIWSVKGKSFHFHNPVPTPFKIVKKYLTLH